ncbi:cellulose binding domain-containing protein [Actinoplanes sp. NPDC049548]|uniref:cellulose binding domain-containing protein n=1 Tax=Actinoplanes sp. NPDC049548 TaxID=3155152 RepID=UPI0034187B72
MSGKPPTGQLGLPRYSFIAAAATLLVILVAWVAARAAGPSDQQTPIMVIPSTSSPASPSPAAAGSVLPSTIPVAAPSPRPKRSTAAPTSAASTSGTSTSTAPTSAAPTPKKPKPTPAGTFTANYRTGATWDQGFIGAVQVTNTGPAAHAWRVRITYPSRAGVEVTTAWNAQVSHSGNTWTFTAADLAPGATATFGFQATQRTRDRVHPTGCVVNGTPCRMG